MASMIQSNFRRMGSRLGLVSDAPGGHADCKIRGFMLQDRDECMEDRSDKRVWAAASEMRAGGCALPDKANAERRSLLFS